jgi:hypothetical protein
MEFCVIAAKGRDLERWFATLEEARAYAKRRARSTGCPYVVWKVVGYRIQWQGKVYPPPAA